MPDTRFPFLRALYLLCVKATGYARSADGNLACQLRLVDHTVVVDLDCCLDWEPVIRAITKSLVVPGPSGVEVRSSDPAVALAFNRAVLRWWDANNSPLLRPAA